MGIYVEIRIHGPDRRGLATVRKLPTSTLAGICGFTDIEYLPRPDEAQHNSSSMPRGSASAWPSGARVSR